jgi:hypothetical protein
VGRGRCASSGRAAARAAAYRTIHYFGGGDVPVFLLQLYAKSERVDLTAAQRNALRAVLAVIAQEYRDRRKRDGQAW